MWPFTWFKRVCVKKVHRFLGGPVFRSWLMLRGWEEDAMINLKSLNQSVTSAVYVRTTTVQAAITAPKVASGGGGGGMP